MGAEGGWGGGPVSRRKCRRGLKEALAISLSLFINAFPKGPRTHYLRILGPLWVPKTINAEYFVCVGF